VNPLHPDRHYDARRKEAEGHFILAVVHGVLDFFLGLLGAKGPTEAQRTREQQMLEDAERAGRAIRDGDADRS